LLYAITVSLLLGIKSQTNAEEFRGIEFPQGVVSFADEVVEYDPLYSGGPEPTAPLFIDPESSLGSPDHDGPDHSEGSVSLGHGGRLTLKFTNNALTGSDDASGDLYIFEIGEVESTFVEISEDGLTWHSVGSVNGATSEIDIDAFGFTSADQFHYIRLTDDTNEGSSGTSTPGADIDAVGAISTVPEPHVPDVLIETAILLKFQSAEGSTYKIQASEDLENWTDEITGIEGDGSLLKYFFEITSPKKFYQVVPQ